MKEKKYDNPEKWVHFEHSFVEVNDRGDEEMYDAFFKGEMIGSSATLKGAVAIIKRFKEKERNENMGA